MDNRKNNKIIKIPIPDGVVDEAAYKQMWLLQRLPILSEPYITASDETELNLAMLPHRFTKAISHLSQTEQDQLFEKKKEWQKMNSKMHTYKQRAFGIALGGQRHKAKQNQFKLTPFEEDIVELLSRMFTVKEVVRIMGEDNGIEVDENDVHLVLKKNIVDIEKRREEFRNRITDVRLYNKRPRLEELAWMFSQMKLRYIAVQTTDAYMACLRTLEQIRKEAEGDIVNINGVLDVNIEVQIQNHIQKQVLRTINLKEIILGRVAARMNYDLKKLIAGLHNSYYAKFTDISGVYDENEQMRYPSNMAYDFGQIELSAGRSVVDVTAEEVTDEEQETAMSAKELFLSKIRAKKQSMESRGFVSDLIGDENRETTKNQTEKLHSQTPEGQKQNKDRDYKTGVYKFKNKK
jgi:hypothetical protein